jgi:hypothetical protein
MSTQKGLRGLLPNKDFIYGTGSIATFHKQILNFIDFIQQTPIPSINLNHAQDGNVDQSVLNSLKGINTDLKNHYVKIQADAQEEMTKVHDTAEVLSKIYSYSRAGEAVVSMIYKAVSSGKTDKRRFEKILTTLDKKLEELQTMIPSNTFDEIHQKLNKDISNLNTDFTNMQNAIPAGDGAKLDLTKLTQKDAFNKLEAQIGSLNKDISSLQEEIAWETFGQVAIGIVGGFIAITNFWNPIGWVAAAGTGVGEWQLAEDKASKATQVDIDQTKVFISEAEEAILKPYYTTKQYASMLSSMVKALEKLSTGIDHLRGFISDTLGDMDNFIKDLGDPDTLELDYELVRGDFKALQQCLHNLMGAYEESGQTDNPKWVKMENEGKWQQILDDPKSPFFIKYVKEGLN